MIRFMVLLVVLPVQAEIVKCVNKDGNVAYRDRPCRHMERRLSIERDYANELSLALPAEDQRIIRQIRREREARRTRRIRRRNAAVSEFVREYEAKEARCVEYKEDYRAMLRFKRRNGSPGKDYESQVIRRMREACSD